MRHRLVDVLLPFMWVLAACGPSAPPSPREDAAADAMTVPDTASADTAPDALAPPDAWGDTVSDRTAPTDSLPDTSPMPPEAAVSPDASVDRVPPPDAMAADVASAMDVFRDATGATCGTRGAPPCPPGTFCNHPISALCGATDLPGTCTPIPTACTREYVPVCGCDGRTYGNACTAAAAGVSVRAMGECPSQDAGQDAQPDVTGGLCGTRGAPPCPPGTFCNHPISALCGATDLPGTCTPIPTACTREYVPVCGCDGRTYGNACTAAAAGVSVRAMGACADTGDAGAVDAGMSCAAQDARGSGLCERFLGYAWDGSSCVGLSGCSCEGRDCGALFSSSEACRAAYARCDCRATGCPAGQRCDACRSPGGVAYVCIPAGAAC